MRLRFLWSRLGVFLTLSLAVLFVWTGISVAFGDQGTLTVSLEISDEGQQLLRKGQSNIIGKLILESEGVKVSMESIKFKTHYDSENTPIERINLLNELGQNMSRSVKPVSDTVSVPLKQPFFIAPNERVELQVEVMVRSIVPMGQRVEFEIPSERYVTARVSDQDDMEMMDTFPLQTPEYVIAEENTEQFVVVDVNPSVPSVTGVERGGNDVPVAEFSFLSYSDEPVEVARVVFDRMGSIENEFLSNIRVLVDGNVIAEGLRVQNTQLVLDEPFVLSAQTDHVLTIMSDISPNTPSGNTIGFEIESWADVQLEGEGADSIDISRKFPLKSHVSPIQDRGIEIAFLPQSESYIERGGRNVQLAQLMMMSPVEQLEFDRVEFAIRGSLGGENISALSLRDAEGERVATASVENGRIVFAPKIGVEPDQEYVFGVVGNIDAQAEEGQTISLGIESETHVVLRSENRTVPSSAKFPLSAATQTVVNDLSRPSVDVEVGSYLFPPKRFVADRTNVPLATFRFVPQNGNGEVQRVELKYIGSADISALSEFRLIDEFGQVLSVGAVEGGDRVVFSDMWALRRDIVSTITLFADVAEIGIGQFVAWEMKSPDAFTVNALTTDDAMVATGNFPLQTPALQATAAPSQPHLRVQTEEVVLAAMAERDQSELVLSRFSLMAVDGQIKVEKILFQSIGSTRDAFRNIELRDEDGIPVARQNNMQTNEIISLATSFSLLEGEQKHLVLVADIKANLPNGATVGVSLETPEYITAKKVRNPSEVDTIGNFPLRSSLFQLPVPTPECSSAYVPVCGKKYDTCAVSPCEPIVQTYQNQCAMEQDFALLIKETACEDDLQEVFQQQVSQIPEAEFSDPVIADADEYPNPFPDTSLETLEGKAAQELARRDVIEGYTDGTFRGDTPVTREQTAKILSQTRYDEVPEIDSEVRFPDIPSDRWSFPFVMFMAEQGIVTGYGDGEFKPTATVTTGEFLKMLSLTLGAELDMDYTYQDVRSTDWFAPYAGMAEQCQMLPERDTFLLAGKALTRREVVVAIYQFLKNCGEEKTM